MQYETKSRSVLKAFSWRTCATLTTAVLVFSFTGEFAMAITIGCLEVFAKMALYFFHERLWHKIGFGKKDVPAFVLWFTGLPASRKKVVADAVHQRLQRDKLKVERLDSLDVRPLFPETGFSRDEVNTHVRRSGHLCSMLEKNGVIAVASFVSPYRESRDFIRGQAQNFVEVYMETTVKACEQRDEKGHYKKARSGEFQNFPGIDVEYEMPVKAEIVIPVDEISVDEAANRIVSYLKTNILIGV
jgi:adenylylsulfate kinase